MNIIIIGQGAIGLLWYHQLAENTHNKVSLICSTRVNRPPENILFTDINNQTTSMPLALANNESLNTADILLVCVKSYQIEAALLPVIEQLNTNASIIFCHNGMRANNHLASVAQPCYVLLTTHASKIITPFHAQHTGLGHNDLGLISAKPVPSIQKKLVSTLSIALPSLTLSDNIKAKQWLKLAINCVINPITALDNINNGQLLNAKYTLAIELLLKEIIAIAAHENITFDFNELKTQVLTIAKNTAENCSSMRSDILQQRPTEIDYINGYIVSLARKVGTSVPENEKIVQQVKRLAT